MKPIWPGRSVAVTISRCVPCMSATPNVPCTDAETGKTYWVCEYCGSDAVAANEPARKKERRKKVLRWVLTLVGLLMLSLIGLAMLGDGYSLP